MDNGLREAELLLKKYTGLRDNLDPKLKRSQITGEAYNEIIEDAKKGIARAKSRNENSGLTIPCVSNLAKFAKKISQQKDCPSEFVDIVNKEFWNLI